MVRTRRPWDGVAIGAALALSWQVCAQDPAPTDAPTRAAQVVTLEALEHEGETLALYAAVTLNERPGWLHVDSAGSASLLMLPQGAGYRAQAGTVRLGALTLCLDGWDGFGGMAPFRDQPVLGYRPPISCGRGRCSSTWRGGAWCSIPERRASSTTPSRCRLGWSTGC